MESGFSCDAPPGYAEAYNEYMKNRPGGMTGNIKPVGKKRST